MKAALSRVLTPVLTLMLALAAPAALLAQEDGRESPIMALLYTWAPVLLIVALWIFFMRRFGWGKGGYKQYMMTNQEHMASIDRNLERIAVQLEKLTEVTEKAGPR
jgi:ATP-dependent Zn protease